MAKIKTLYYAVIEDNRINVITTENNIKLYVDSVDYNAVCENSYYYAFNGNLGEGIGYWYIENDFIVQ